MIIEHGGASRIILLNYMCGPFTQLAHSFSDSWQI